MPRSTEGGSSGGHSRAKNILDWLNRFHHSLVPPQINHHRGSDGKVGLAEFQTMPENMRQRIIDSFDNRKELGDSPFPHYATAEPAANDAGSHPGGPNGGGGGGGPHPGGNGGGNHQNGGGGGGGQHNGVHGNKASELAAEYGWSMAFLNHHPELKKLFHQAVQHTWSPERFVAELRDTNWFQHHSASVRQFMVNRATDPASWQADLNKTEAHVRNVWGSLFGTPIDNKLAEKWAVRAMKFGWSEEQINDQLVNTMNFRKLLRNDSMGGTAAQTANQINALASDYGIHTGNQWVARQMENVLKGNDTMDGVLNTIKERAKNHYEAFADQLDAGKTMADIADPYRQQMAQLLEMNPNQIKITGNALQKALTRRVEGKTQPMSLGDFSDFIRKDPRWMHTQQANDQFEQTAYGLLTSWGVI